MAENSRLFDGSIYYGGKNIPIQKYRDIILARSLYNYDNEYENTQLFSSNNQSNVTSSILTVLNTIPKYNSIQANTNLLGNTYDAFREGGSPLARIGLVMLGKQIAYNSASIVSTRVLPIINFSNMLKNGDKVIERNIDNRITVENREDRTVLDRIGVLSDGLFGTYDVFGSPFTDDPTNTDYLNNTGRGQLSQYFKATNLNLYKPTVPTDVNKNVEKGREFAAKDQKNSISDKKWFLFDDKAKPYFSTSYTWVTSLTDADTDMNKSYSGTTNQEYAPKYSNIADFGITNIVNNEGVGEESNIVKDAINKNNNLVWGRDGVSDTAKSELNKNRGYAELAEGSEDSINDFKIKKGLLHYTKNLLNATEGSFVDITRKRFTKGIDTVGFNGSPLFTPNISDYNDKSGQKYGTRQHTALDPYNNKAKLIRYDGNAVYKGSPDSVINNSVLPRIHPTRDKRGNENLMLSLENLAIGTIKRDTYGVIDDEYATAIPLSEAGPFGGRIMWFPPYNLQVQEVALAKYESTVMIGRNEPMYNYMNSERTAVLNFTLLIDYPEQLRNVDYDGENKNEEIAKFFAFGGDSLPLLSEIENWENRIKTLKKQKEDIGGSVDQSEPAPIKVNRVSTYFQNDYPAENEINNIFNIMYNNPNHYEILKGCLSAQDGNGFGLNRDVYFIEGLSGNTDKSDQNNLYKLTGSSDQYNVSGITGQYGRICELNKNLKDVYENEDNRKYYDIRITAAASKLGSDGYNLELGDRRVRATKKLISSRLKALFPALGDKGINIIEVTSVGSVDGSAEGALVENKNKEVVKQERVATIFIERNSVEPENKKIILSPKQQNAIDEINKEIANLTLKINSLKHNDITNENIFKDRSDISLNGFTSISKNQYYPLFHSQTPEDFHRRLTFLQQCTRQGAAKRYGSVEENGILRARNSVFGKQPICILRVGDFFYTKVIIDNVTIDYNDTTWDLNPEGFGLQPMIANVTLQMKLIGGQSLKGPIDALQNAVSFNYYANSNFNNKGVNSKATKAATDQMQYLNGVLTKKNNDLENKYKSTDAYKREGDV